MPKGKPLTQMVPDIREALNDSLEKAAYDVTMDLKVKGPYWTGFFESLWQVNPGKTAVRPNIKDPSTRKVKIRPKDITKPDIPESPNLNGYTIGNRANYRLYAMDILPSPTGRQGGDAPNKTAPKKWFETYVQAQMRKTINNAFTSVFKRYS